MQLTCIVDHKDAIPFGSAVPGTDTDDRVFTIGREVELDYEIADWGREKVG